MLPSRQRRREHPAGSRRSTSPPSRRHRVGRTPPPSRRTEPAVPPLSGRRRVGQNPTAIPATPSRQHLCPGDAASGRTPPPSRRRRVGCIPVSARRRWVCGGGSRISVTAAPVCGAVVAACSPGWRHLSRPDWAAAPPWCTGWEHVRVVRVRRRWLPAAVGSHAGTRCSLEVAGATLESHDRRVCAPDVAELAVRHLSDAAAAATVCVRCRRASHPCVRVAAGVSWWATLGVRPEGVGGLDFAGGGGWF
jgi:hypothetical protein